MDGAEQRLLPDGFSNPRQTVQCFRNYAVAARVLSNLESRRISLRESVQIVVGESKDFTEDADNFVTRVWIGHDRQKRRQPGMCRAFTFSVAFRLELDCEIHIRQCVSQGSQPRFPRTQNCDLPPGFRAQLFKADIMQPGSELTCFQ